MPDALVVVVGGDERDGAVGAADPGDDRGQDVGQLRVDDQQPFGVGPRGGPVRNPDVVIDTDGEVYPLGPRGVPADDSIGNILDCIEEEDR